MGNYLAFDLGASSGRAIIGRLADGKLSLQEVHRFPNAPVNRDGALYWDIASLQNELKTGLGKAIAAEPDLDGLAFDTWGVDYVLFDKTTGIPKRAPYHYRDERNVKAAERVWKKLSPEKIYAATGIQRLAINTLYQLAAHRDEHPEDFQNAVFLPIPDALALALGGDFTGEYTHGSTSNLIAPSTRNWCWELIDELGLPRSIFPTLVAPCTKGGTLSVELQRQFGGKAVSIWKVGSHDTASAVAAVPAPEQGNWAYICTGTWALLGAEVDHAIITAASEKENFTNEGGLAGTIRFLTNIMGSWLFQETRRVWNESGRDVSFADLENMARAAVPGKYFVNPNAVEFAAPCDMPQRIRDFCRSTGQGDQLTDAEVVRAIYDSLALYFRCKLDTLAGLIGKKYAALNVVGGGTKDKLLMQLTADAIGIPVVAGPVEATATGNVLAQAIAAGELADLAAARRVVRASFDVATYAPATERRAEIDVQLARFREIVGQ